MFDHITIHVSDFQKSKAFYEKSLAPLGYKVIAGEEGIYSGFGDKRPQFWISQSDELHPHVTGVHIAFSCANRELVDAIYHAAIDAGGKDNGKPGLRPKYHENYYGAFFIDPDGNNIEAVNGNGLPICF